MSASERTDPKRELFSGGNPPGGGGGRRRRVRELVCEEVSVVPVSEAAVPEAPDVEVSGAT